MLVMNGSRLVVVVDRIGVVQHGAREVAMPEVVRGATLLPALQAVLAPLCVAAVMVHEGGW